MEEARERRNKKLQEQPPTGIMFDSRIDKHTLVMTKDEETKKSYPGVQAEDHYSITDADGNYLHHFTKPGKVTKDDEDDNEDEDDEENNVVEEQKSEAQQTLEKKPAEQVARIICDWIVNNGLDKTLTHLGADSTSSNTGWKKGVIAWIEKILGRKFHWLICMLHTNELGLRKLMAELDGKTCSKTGFSGPLGKLLEKVNDMQPNFDFKKIELGPDLPELPAKVESDLSRDQKVLYKRWKAVKTGILPKDVALYKPGPIVHSRWLTFADTFLQMYMSKHKLEGELLLRLETIVTYIVSVYCPMWFRIKANHSWLEGPRHILTEMKLFQLQPTSVQKILLPTLRRSAWFSHSEPLLSTMSCSEDKEERVFASDMILKIRGKNKFGNTKPRPMKLPSLNLQATRLQDMIDWTGAKEPVITCSLTKEQIKEIKEEPLKAAFYSLHTQGMERAVKETTSASGTVYGQERRDGLICVTAENRQLMSALETKADFANLVF